MKIETYVHEEDKINQYLNFFKRHYPEQQLNQHVSQIKKLLDKKNPFFKNGELINFLAKEKDNVLGHCSAILDKRNKDVGLIGFYDCVEDIDVNNELLKNCINWLNKKGCSKIRGPINLSIWNNYRFVIENKRNLEIFDPISKKYYVKFWESKGFNISKKYISAIRSNFTKIISDTEKDHFQLNEKGYTIRSFNTKNPFEDLERIWHLSNEIFLKSWNFVPLTFKEFMYIYDDIIESVDLSLSEIVEDLNANPVGFCFTLINPDNNKQLILKTLGVLPEHRQKGIANALVHSQHIKASEKKFLEFYYPLINQENNISKMSKEDCDIITEYATFELIL